MLKQNEPVQANDELKLIAIKNGTHNNLLDVIYAYARQNKSLTYSEMIDMLVTSFYEQHKK